MIFSIEKLAHDSEVPVVVGLGVPICNPPLRVAAETDLSTAPCKGVRSVGCHAHGFAWAGCGLIRNPCPRKAVGMAPDNRAWREVPRRRQKKPREHSRGLWMLLSGRRLLGAGDEV